MAEAEDITGKVYGNWTAISRSSTKSWSTWNFRCLCGNIRKHSKSKIVNGLVKGCLSCRDSAINCLESGYVCGKWTLISKIDKYHWLCKCDCARTEKQVHTTQLLAAKKRFGGCQLCQVDKRRTEPGWQAKISTLNAYKKQARKRNIHWDIGNEDFCDYFKGNCYYCGLPPSNVAEKRGDKFIYSGVDRIDSNLGYTKDNLVSCCKWCNLNKRERNVKQFLDHCDMVSNYWRTNDKLRKTIEQSLNSAN